MAELPPQREADQIPMIAPPEQTLRICGHAVVTKTLFDQIAAKRLPGAWLLHGPRGIGKATLAFFMARTLLEKTGDEEPGRISEQVGQGTHPNLVVLRKKPKDAKGFYTVIRVQDVRDLRERLHQTRGRAGYRLCVVDSIDDCNANAANALLKMLEEPPSQTLFILISHRPGALLPTIRSRCQSHALRPLADADLSEAVRATGFSADPELTRLAAGRPRRALQLQALGQSQMLVDMMAWLDAPETAPKGTHLQLGDALGGAGDTEAGLARELLLETFAAQARSQALAQGSAIPLASAAELWEKANQAFASAEIYNLDMRQTYVSLFDAFLDFRNARHRPSS